MMRTIKNITIAVILFSTISILIALPASPAPLGSNQNIIQTGSKSDSLKAWKKTLMRSAQEFIRLRQWDKAIESLNHYVISFPNEKLRIAKIITILEQPETDLQVKNLGPNINSRFHDYYPIISTDGNSLFFTSRHRTGGLGGEDVWASKRINNEWSKAVNLGKPINTKMHEGFMCLSADSLTAFIFGNYEDSHGNGDIYCSTYGKNGWSEVQNVGEPISSPDFEGDAWFSSNNTTVFFVSDRPGGVGEYRPRSENMHPNYNTDIYVSEKIGDHWAEPINLGDKINTPYCERGPLFHPDGRTLFFCSSGHPGLGDLDIFVSYKTGDKWTDWSEPENLGKEINTVFKDWGYSISLTGDKVYFASVRDSGYGRSDIYVSNLPRRFTIPVTVVSGKLTDQNGKFLDEVKLDWEDIEKYKKLGTARTRPQGDYTIYLPSGRWYRYTATKEGYIFASRDVDLRTEDKPKLVYDIKLPKITPETVPFPPALLKVFFKLNSSELRPESKSELDQFLKLVHSHPEWIKIEISGHTCDLGSNSYNKKLSQRRAQSVVDYIVNLGESPDRFIAVGYGFDKPLKREFTDEARKRNRRVEFTVLEVDLKAIK